jgi:hypothetical protein
MTDDTFDRNDPAYQAGYDDMMLLHEEAQRRGWRVPPERFLVREIVRLEHSAAAAPRSNLLPVLSHSAYPAAWYRGRADAIRDILRRLHEEQSRLKD